MVCCIVGTFSEAAIQTADRFLDKYRLLVAWLVDVRIHACACHLIVCDGQMMNLPRFNCVLLEEHY